MLRKIAKIGVVAGALLPMFASAQGGASSCTGFGCVTGLIQNIQSAVNLLIPLLFGIALLVFIWGLVKFIFASGDEEAKETGKRIMIWGIIALFVMASVWGLVNFLAQTLGVSGGTLTLPSIPGASNATTP